MSYFVHPRWAPGQQPTEAECYDRRCLACGTDFDALDHRRGRPIQFASLASYGFENLICSGCHDEIANGPLDVADGALGRFLVGLALVVHARAKLDAVADPTTGLSADECRAFAEYCRKIGAAKAALGKAT